MIYILSGSVEVRREDKFPQLDARDVLYIAAETPRTYRCLGETSASALIISFDSDSGELRRSSSRPPALRSGRMFYHGLSHL